VLIELFIVLGVFIELFVVFIVLVELLIVFLIVVIVLAGSRKRRLSGAAGGAARAS